MLAVLVAGLLLPHAAADGASPAAGETTSSVAPVAAVSQATPEPPRDRDRDRYVRGDSNIEFRWGMLMDSIALAVSYAWLCCGVLIVLAIPIFFIVLWVRGRNRQQP